MYGPNLKSVALPIPEIVAGALKLWALQTDGRTDSSGSSKVVDFGTNRKRVCDFLLGCHSNLGPISHCFGDIAGFLCS